MSTVQLLADAVLLTGSPVASIASNTGGLSKHVLFINYSPDTDSTNALEVTIEMSPDPTGDTFHPYTPEYTGVSGTVTPNTQITFSFGSDGVADQLESPIFFSGACQRVRIKYSETNTPADFGNITATLFSSRT